MSRRRARRAERWPRRRSAARRRCASATAAVIAAATRAAIVALGAQREERRPGSRQAAAERAGIDGRALDRRQARHERRAARLGDRVLERAARSARSRRGAGRRTSAPRLAHCRIASASGTVVAEQRARLRRLDLEIGMHDDRGQTRRHRQPDDVGRIRRGGRARSRRRSHGAMLSACADPAPSRSPSSAQAISVSSGACAPSSASTATTAAAALAALPPSPLDERQPLADASAPRRAARRASSAAPARPRRPCCAPRRAAAGRRRPSMLVDLHARRRASARGHLVARRFEREAEDVEAARDVRHGRRRKGGDTIGHEAVAVVLMVGMRYSRNARSKS